MAAAGVIRICNRALQLVGANRIVDFDDNSPSARACDLVYEPRRDAELRAHSWRFAIRRASLAAVDPAPSWGRANEFLLPSDCLRLYQTYPELNGLDIDYEIEGRSILTDFTAPLEIRYIARIEDPNQMDSLFKEMLSHSMAIAFCEELTQSTTKKTELRDSYDEILKQARKANAFETRGITPPEDPWITVRQ
jgi:hypothetical protein